MSTDTGGGQLPAASAGGTVSVDGRYAVFVSDRRTGTVERIAHRDQPARGSSHLDLSADGRYVAYTQNDPRGSTGPLMVHDRRTGTEEQANVTSDGKPAQRYGLDPSLPAEGRSIAFHYGGDDLVPNGAAVNTATYVRDLRMDTTRGIVHDGAGGQGVIGAPRISRDGLCVACTFQAPQSQENVYVRDLRTGASRLAGEAGGAGGPVTDDGVYVTSFGGGGALLGLGSGSGQLVTGDTNGVSDGFVRHLR